MKQILFFILVLFTIFIPPLSLNAQLHSGDIAVGRTSDGKLKLANLPDHMVDLECLEAVRSGHPLFSGWSGNTTGFDRITTAGPDPNFFPLQSGAQIYLQLVNGVEGFRVVNALNLGVIDDPDEEFLLGGSTLHIHPFWNFNTSPTTGDKVLPADFTGRIFVTFKLNDRGSTAYENSNPFTMAFSNDPNPFADVNEDGMVSPLDISALSQRWLESFCRHPGWCDRTDIDQNGHVDLGDFAWIAFQWLETEGCP